MLRQREETRSTRRGGRGPLSGGRSAVLSGTKEGEDLLGGMGISRSGFWETISQGRERRGAPKK